MVDLDEMFGHPPLDDLLSIEQASPGRVNVYFLPLPRIRVGDEAEEDVRSRVRLLQVDVVKGLLTIFPTNNLVNPAAEVRSKYRRIERISLAGGDMVYTVGDGVVGESESKGKFLGSYFGKTEPMAVEREIVVPELEETVPTSAGDVMSLLEGLPQYFVRDPPYGLGFRRRYRSIVQAIEDLTNAKEIRISVRGPTEYEENSRTFVVSLRDMLALTKAIERVDKTTRTAANTVNETSTYNTLADVLGLPRRVMRYGRSELRKALTAVGNDERRLSRAEQVELVGTLTSNANSILKREPATMDGLESSIAIARMGDLLENVRKMMKESVQEKSWQRFFQNNPFVLSMVFGRPIVKVAGHASVGGRKISGGGHKIVDFLVRNALTNNAALVEIKTPSSKLLNERPYRENVYTPAGELVGAINQALDQKNKFEQEIASMRYHNRTLVVEAHHVQACVLAGTMPSGDDRVRSFELFRHNLKDVVVVTFDELLRKVEDLSAFLEGRYETKDDGVPF